MEEFHNIIEQYLGLEPFLIWLASLIFGLFVYVFLMLLFEKKQVKKNLGKKAFKLPNPPPTPKPGSAPKAEPKPEPKPELKPEPKPKTKSELKPEEPKPELKHEPKPKPKSELKPEKPKPELKPEPKPGFITTKEKSIVREKLPEGKIETKNAQVLINRVNYTSTKKDQTESFPIVRFPKMGTVVRSHREGSTKRRGYKEESFQNSIQRHFGSNFNVLGNIRINTGMETRPFEPDIALIDKNNNSLCIDIEIDEPYAGITRQPTHCKGEDTLRDIYFTDRGWIVVRFSEYQVHTAEKKCLQYLAEIIKSIKPNYIIPSSLNESATLNEKLWNAVQAQKWEKAKYRENYLNHEFGIHEIDRVETTERGFNDQEQEEEGLVKPSSIGIVDNSITEGFNRINSHSRDKRIAFYPEPHIYTIDNTPAPSASTLIGRFFPEFDSEYWSAQKAPGLGMTPREVAKMWSDKGQKAAVQGTHLHEQIEKYYLGQDYEKPEEFSLFEKFVEDHSHITPYRSEWRIFDEEHHIAGTIDLISRNGNGYEIYDWKRSKKVVSPLTGLPITDNKLQKGIGFLNDIDDTSYNRYCLQQSLYRYILEKNYGVNISKMHLVVLYPEYTNYHKVEVPYLKDKVEYILKTL